MSGPLDGVRVLDLSHVLNGPFSTMLLADMGAEVIKLEYGEGDRYRHSWMPPDAGRDGYEFLAVNANKKCITLNLKHSRGKEIFVELVKQSDVLVENFSVGVMDRLGFSYFELQKINPRLIYARSSGFGKGPYENVRAFAPTIMAMTGWMSKSWEFSGSPGTRVLGIGDEAAGVSLALGICAALYGRTVTGEGQELEVGMQDALMGFMVSSFHTEFEGQSVGGDPFQCADGYVSFHLADIKDELFEHLAIALDHPEALDDPEFSTPMARRRNFPEVEKLVAGWVRAATRSELWAIFKKHGIASSPVLTVGEVLEDENVKARGSFVEVEHPKAGKIKLLRPWVRFSKTKTSISHAGPAIGEHNAEVYRQLLGFGEKELSELEDAGVI